MTACGHTCDAKRNVSGGTSIRALATISTPTIVGLEGLEPSTLTRVPSTRSIRDITALPMRD